MYPVDWVIVEFNIVSDTLMDFISIWSRIAKYGNPHLARKAC